MRSSHCTLLLCCLVACAAPERGDPDKVVVKPPTSWRTAGAEAGKVERDWWRKLGDPALSLAIERTLEHNHDLQAAQARLAAAAIQARLAGADLWPQLDAGTGASRQKTVFVGLPVSFGGGSGPLTNRYDTFGVNLNASWEIDLWGRVAAGKDAASAELRASAEQLRGLRQSLAAQTAKAWFAAVEANQQLELARTTVASYTATEAQVESRFRRGVRSPFDLRLARSRRMSAQALEHSWSERYARATRQLEVLQGKYPDGLSQIPSQLPKPAAALPAGLPAEIVRRRPDLVAAEQRLLAAGFRVDEAQASLYPRLSLTGQVGTTSDSAEDLLDLDYLIWNIAANLVAPIFSGGRLRGQVDLAAARENEAIANFAQSVLRAYSEVESLLAARGFIAMQADSLAAAQIESRAARNLAEDRYRSGLGDFIAVLEAQRSSLLIDGQLLSARRLLLDLRVDLHLALGGGFELDAELQGAGTNVSDEERSDEPR